MALEVVMRSYVAGILKIEINGEMWEYEVSPFRKEKFEVQLRHNKGRALALLKGHELCLQK